MHKQPHYAPPGVERHRVVLEQFIAASYKMSFTTTTEYDDYVEESLDASQDVIIIY